MTGRCSSTKCRTSPRRPGEAAASDPGSLGRTRRRLDRAPHRHQNRRCLQPGTVRARRAVTASGWICSIGSMESTCRSRRCDTGATTFSNWRGISSNVIGRSGRCRCRPLQPTRCSRTGWPGNVRGWSGDRTRRRPGERPVASTSTICRPPSSADTPKRSASRCATASRCGPGAAATRGWCWSGAATRSAWRAANWGFRTSGCRAICASVRRRTR